MTLLKILFGIDPSRFFAGGWSRLGISWLFVRMRLFASTGLAGFFIFGVLFVLVGLIGPFFWGVCCRGFRCGFCFWGNFDLVRGPEFNFEFARIFLGRALGTVDENFSGNLDRFTFVKLRGAASFEVGISFLVSNEGKLSTFEVKESHSFGRFEGVCDLAGNRAFFPDQCPHGVFLQRIGAGKILRVQAGQGQAEKKEGRVDFHKSGERAVLERGGGGEFPE